MTTPSPARPDTRATFEALMCENGGLERKELRRRDMPGSARFGEYVLGFVELAWQAWQVSRAAALEEAAQIADAAARLEHLMADTSSGSACRAARKPWTAANLAEAIRERAKT